MVLLDRLLPRLKRQGHKVLIFSQFSMMLDVLEDYLELRAAELGSYERVDGAVKGEERQRAIDRYQTDPDCFVFLLTTRAGGQGINLTAADTVTLSAPSDAPSLLLPCHPILTRSPTPSRQVVIYDSDWNPQGDMQGQARAHRIGQERPVHVYRLVTRETEDARTLSRHRR